MTSDTPIYDQLCYEWWFYPDVELGDIAVAVDPDCLRYARLGFVGDQPCGLYLDHHTGRLWGTPTIAGHLDWY